MLLIDYQLKSDVPFTGLLPALLAEPATLLSMEQARELAAKLRGRRVAGPPPGSLLTESQAAARLGCSVKTLRGHIASGALRYVQVGRGSKRIRRKFADADLDAFVASQTRTEVPQWPSSVTRVRRTGASTSKCEVIAFSAQPKPQRGAKPKP